MDRGRRARQLTLVCALLHAACGDAGGVGDEPPREPGEYPLIDHSRWAVVAPDEDPFLRADSTIPEACEGSTYGAELFGNEDVFSVDGLDCLYMTVEQPTLFAVRTGDRIRVRLWNFELTGRRGTTADLAISLNGQNIWEKQLPIPSRSGLTVEFVDVVLDAPADSPLLFHVENHGSNSYSLFEVTLLVAEPVGDAD